MQIMNTFVAKMGPAGKRNRAARRRIERRGQGKCKSVHDAAVNRNKAECVHVGESTETLIVPVAVLDLAGSWDEQLARKALELFANSGKSKRAFASEHNFPESRLRSWEKKFALLTIN